MLRRVAVNGKISLEYPILLAGLPTLSTPFPARSGSANNRLIRHDTHLEAIKTGGHVHKLPHFADDTVIFVASIGGVKNVLDAILPVNA